MSDTSIITRIRAYVSDKGTLPTITGGKYDFDDSDILAAAEAAVRSYNELGPVSMRASSIDTNYNFWFDGIAAHLYGFLIQRLMKQDLDFTAGEVVVSPVAKQLRTCEALQAKYARSFETGAARYKLSRNLNQARGRIG